MGRSTNHSAALTLRALNRATLARQMLLAREDVSPLRAIERLVALQAQQARPPFVGLWTRVAGFRREDLARLIARRQVVRGPLLRGTLHFATARDFVKLRPALQPALTRAADAILKTRMKGIDLPRAMKDVSGWLREKPRTFDQIRDLLQPRYPKGDIRAIAYAVRTHLPLVQVPSDDAPWSYTAASDFALAAAWVGEDIAEHAGPDELVLRYLAAFGPANARDIQTWSGLPDTGAALERLRPKLVVLAGEKGRELYDLPKAPRPPEDTPAPVRFLPEFDNLVLSHADRTRFVADAHRKRVYLPALQVAATVLVDGFVAAAWKIERAKGAATLVVEPFAPLAKAARGEIEREAEELVRFVEPDAAQTRVRVGK
jgi:hypothetical protein